MRSPERLNRRFFLAAGGHRQSSTYSSAGVGLVDHSRCLPAGRTVHLQAEKDAARLNGVSYSRLMGGLKKADVRLNRKMLAQLAVVDPGSFTNVVAAAKS